MILMKKYEKPYLEAEIINFVDICLASPGDGDINDSDDDFSNEN